MGFRAPLADILFTMRHVADLDGVVSAGGSPELSSDMIEAILEAAGDFAETGLDAINRDGDRIGCVLTDGAVTTPPGWRETYRAFAEAGWNGVTASAEWGGQGLPVMVHAALQELWNAGAASFAVGPMLTMSAIEAIEAHATKDLKALYLPKLVAGTWMATMNLTEPQAGSDVGALRSRAERAGDGTYRIFGQKIFITYGEHDLAENIIHLVLARLADAPPGTGGISLFLVPKFLPDGNGAPGERNDLVCAGIEHKLGLHGSPTCTMSYGDKGDGAVGWLVGEENRGLAAMFTMMNIARLTVGVQGIGIAARAFDRALAYAHERTQGRAVGAPAGTASPIVEHPDVQRDLLRMKSLTMASRAVAMLCAEAIDRSRLAPAAERGFWAERASLLTPIAKAFSTDAGIEVASLGIQVHGGAGYIEETGAAQYLRDARIFPIYEGTNGIQAIDLVTRKLRLRDGKAVDELLAEFGAIVEKAAALNRPEFNVIAARLREALAALAGATDFLLRAQADGRMTTALVGATPYLRLFGLTAGGALLAKGALHAVVEGQDGWIAIARFFAETMLGETASLARTVIEGAESLEKAAGSHLLGGAAEG
jgi:acyl-CoA dehydrogenase